MFQVLNPVFDRGICLLFDISSFGFPWIIPIKKGHLMQCPLSQKPDHFFIFSS